MGYMAPGHDRSAVYRRRAARPNRPPAEGFAAIVSIEEPRRCEWCGTDPLYRHYHDTEWGVPVYDSRALFERLMLEGQQAGLAWITVLRKRETMHRAFFRFDPERLAFAGEAELRRWLEDPGVIRHRGKLETLITNARAYLRVEDGRDGGFSRWLWSFVDGAPRRNFFEDSSQVPAETAQSRAMARALKAEGFRFVGPVTCYAFMQSAGLVNDHLLYCDFRDVAAGP